jgi:hypothetical protein
VRRRNQNRLVPSDNEVSKGHTPRCGASASAENPPGVKSNLAPGDNPGVMRYDRGGTWAPGESPQCLSQAGAAEGCRNKCFASCAEGYTAHESSQTQQIFTCNRDGTYSGSLTCDLISCPFEALDAISTGTKSATSCPGCSQAGAHANRSTWNACKTENHFNDQCDVKCAKGSVPYVDGKLIPPGSEPKPYKCVAIDDGDFPENGDRKYLKHGVWTYDGAKPNANNKSPVNLQCIEQPCNGSATGTCTHVLAHGASCAPDCGRGFVLNSLRRCELGRVSGGECIQCTHEMCKHEATCVTKAPENGYKCNCTDGWAGSDCTANANSCKAYRPCNKIDLDATCRKDGESVRGYICNCSSGYSSSAEDGANCDVHESKFTLWEVICIAATVASVAPVPFMVRRFRRSLGRLHDPQLPEGKDAVGLFGSIMFVFGVGDLVLDIGLCLTLVSCGQVVLLCCCLTTLAVTTTMTWYLGYSTLKGIVRADRREGSPSSAWLMKHPLIGPLIVLASSSRLNSMAILRLRICGRMLIDFPDSADHRFFYFMRNAGLYHFWVEDIPHALISTALLYAADDEGRAACMAHGHSKMVHVFDRPLELPFGDRDIAWASLFASVGSILFGLVSRMMLLLTVSVARNDESVRELPTIRTSMLDLVESLQRRGHTCESLLDCVEARDSDLPGVEDKTKGLLQLSGSE